MASKRYYWIKLKTDFFNLPEIDWLLSQKNGAEYIVLYQMLCLMTANNNGELSSKFGEMIVPYDVDKIARDTKYFDFDTVKIALELYKKLGLVYESENDMLRISKYEEMIGSESSWAEKKRRYRQRKTIENNEVQEIGHNEDSVQDNFRQEIDIEKEIEIDKEIDKEIDIKKEKINKKEKIPYEEIIDCLNRLAGTNYRATSKKTRELINGRWEEGYRLQDFETVIKKKCDAWIGTKYEEYLAPTTLFRPINFERYLNAKINKEESQKGGMVF